MYADPYGIKVLLTSKELLVPSLREYTFSVVTVTFYLTSKELLVPSLRVGLQRHGLEELL